MKINWSSYDSEFIFLPEDYQQNRMKYIISPFRYKPIRVIY